MKFFDFLQDVTFVGVLLGVSSFLIDGSRDLMSSADAAPASAGHFSGSPELDSINVDDFLGEASPQPTQILPDATDNWSTTGTATLPDAPATSPAAPAPLDLDMLDRVLSDELGLRRERPNVAPPAVAPAPVDSVERVFTMPAPPSRPIAGVTRTFDDANLFEQEFGVAEKAAAPSLQTRRLGPVDYLAPPVDEF